MALRASQPLIEHSSALEDTRQFWKVLRPLPDVSLVMLCGTPAKAAGLAEVRRLSRVHLDFLRHFMPYAAGLPSHDAAWFKGGLHAELGRAGLTLPGRMMAP